MPSTVGAHTPKEEAVELHLGGIARWQSVSQAPPSQNSDWENLFMGGVAQVRMAKCSVFTS